MDKRSAMGTQFARIVPAISERRCGGWIAVSGPDAPLKIGVTADTEEGARAAFAKAVTEWEAILNSKSPKDYAERRCQ